MDYSIYVISLDNKVWELTEFGFVLFDSKKVKPSKTSKDYKELVQYVIESSKGMTIQINDIHHKGIVMVENGEIKEIFDKFSTGYRVKELEELWNNEVESYKNQVVSY